MRGKFLFDYFLTNTWTRLVDTFLDLTSVASGNKVYTIYAILKPKSILPFLLAKDFG